MKGSETEYPGGFLSESCCHLFSFGSPVFALFLFFYVNADQLTSGQSTGHALTTSTNEKSIVIEMPLKVKGAKDTEFVAGLPDKVKVRIIGPSAIVTAINNTRNFEVYADLTGKGYGKHTITLSQSGLSKEVSAKIDPQTVKVKISKKATKTFPVQARYNSSNVASGYATGSVTMNNQTVRVTGAKNDVKNVEIVVANVNIPSGTKNDVVRSVILQALDKKGKSLDVVFDPETVRVTIPIFEASSSKKVSLNLVQSDGDKNRSYSISTDTKTVVLHGTKQALSKVSTLTVPVSVEGVTSSVTRTIQLQSTISGIASISPATISVTITASGDNNESSADVSQTNKIDNSLNNDKTEDDSSKTSSNISVSSSNSEKSSESNN